jgi:GntR family transcriptional regulator
VVTHRVRARLLRTIPRLAAVTPSRPCHTCATWPTSDLGRLTVVLTVAGVGIDPLGSVPVYQQLAGILRGDIESGRLRPGRPLPSYIQLMQEYEVARGTAAKAVQVLVSEGLVRIVPGKGAFVIDR